MNEKADAALRFVDFSMVLRDGERRHVILDHCNLELPRGGFYLWMGESGSGKSTVLKWITGLWDAREARPMVSGESLVLGVSVHNSYPRVLRHEVAAVLQDEGLLDELSPRENVELALRAAGRSTKLAVALLSQAGLPDPPASVFSLSGGMRKRAAVARGLAAEPALFLFDEPTTGLDAAAARGMAELIYESHLRTRGRCTTIVISHDVEAFNTMATGVLEIDTTSKQLVVRDPGGKMNVPSQAQLARAVAATEGDPALRVAKQILAGLGSLAQTLLASLAHLPPVFPRLAKEMVVRSVLESVLFVVLGSAMLGGLATYFALRNSPLEGAFEDEILAGLGKVLVSVLTPLMAGFFFTARMAAGAAARLGTMKRSNQVASLQLMGIHPADYLLSPMVWGFCLALPLVTFGAIVMSALASAWASWGVAGISRGRWSEAFFHSLDAEDLRSTVLKTVISAFFVAVWTYHLATGPKRSGRDVGIAVNLSIVLGMLTVLAVHGVLTLWQFA